jgi:CRISPR type III-B/RAMP module-associated protein Cmr3
LTTEEGKLYSNTGIYLKSRQDDDVIDLSICFDLIGENKNDISGQAYLGGERKRITLDTPAPEFPPCPDYFNDQPFLKIILTTHGDFGGWCPDFLQPDLHTNHIPWTTLPQTDFKIRLRSACIDKWDTVSGIDYTIKDKRNGKGAKAMKKLVRPGAVYLIEVKEKNQSQDIARHLWGQNLKNTQEPGSNDIDLGYGQCIVGRTTILPTHC